MIIMYWEYLPKFSSLTRVWEFQAHAKEEVGVVLDFITHESFFIPSCSEISTLLRKRFKGISELITQNGLKS